jgi:cation diffusion facilitator CzcD-associated flavoprotein CzcO
MIRVALAPVLRAIGNAHLRRAIADPALRAKATPDYLPGCKRILVANDYLPSLSRPNVELVTDAVAEVRAHSIVTADGVEREVDTIIFGTGFHVLDLPIAEQVRDGEGLSLADHWQGSPQALRGTTVAGFPNLFFLLGPNTGLGHNSVVYMAESQVQYIVAALTHANAHRLPAIAPAPDAQRAWNEAIQGRMKGTVWTEGGCQSWYLDRNGLNTSLWPDFSFRFRRAVSRFDPAEYLVHTGAPASPDAEPVLGVPGDGAALVS